MAWEELYDLVRGPHEPDGFARRRRVHVTVERARDADRAITHVPEWWRDRGPRRGPHGRGCKTRHRARLHGLQRRRHRCLPRDPGVHREHEWDRGITLPPRRPPPLDGDGGRSGQCEHQKGDEKDHSGNGMRVGSVTTLAEAARKARGVPRVASGNTPERGSRAEAADSI